MRPSASDVVYDLGCGQGQFLIEAARVYGCRGLGVDLDEGTYGTGAFATPTPTPLPSSTTPPPPLFASLERCADRVSPVRGLSSHVRHAALLEQARAAAAAAGVSERVEFRAVDLHELPLEDATVVVVFLLPAALSSIAASLEAHLRARPGAPRCGRQEGRSCFETPSGV